MSLSIKLQEFMKVLGREDEIPSSEAFDYLKNYYEEDQKLRTLHILRKHILDMK